MEIVAQFCFGYTLENIPVYLKVNNTLLNTVGAFLLVIEADLFMTKQNCPLQSLSYLTMYAGGITFSLLMQKIVPNKEAT